MQMALATVSPRRLLLASLYYLKHSEGHLGMTSTSNPTSTPTLNLWAPSGTSANPVETT